ncbi:MAG: hypothetical protein EA396_12500 [Anaerolineaceae bacterium]|nr:MAG: hypothetical protein EA396_12500 [Anaerolineaceae bacterium]
MTQETSNEELLQLGIQAVKRKDKQNARFLLMQVYERDKRNEVVLMWLAKIADDRQDRIRWLERVLDVNPDNAAAKRGLNKLKYKQASDENRKLLLFGGVAVLMIVLVLAVIIIALTS